MARYDASMPYTPDYDDDCAYCGDEYPRGELAWSPTFELECADCEHKRIQRAAAQSMADQGHTVECQGTTFCAPEWLPDKGSCEACNAPRADDPDFCPACLTRMADATTPTFKTKEV